MYRHKHIFFTLVFFIATFCKAQGDLLLKGMTTKDKIPLSGATITFFQDGKRLTQIITGKNGKFKITLDLGYDYRVVFNYPNCQEMYLKLNTKIPQDKMWIYPELEIDVPFFELGNKQIDLTKFSRAPFQKIVFDGDKGFYEDPTYNFVAQLYNSKEEEAKKLEEKKKLEEFDAKVKAEAEARIRAEAAAKNEFDARQKAELDLQKLKTELEKALQNAALTKSIEEKENALVKQKELKRKIEEKNKEIKSLYSQNIVKIIAVNDKQQKTKTFTQLKQEALENTSIELMKKDAKLKAEADNIRQEQKQKQKQSIENKRLHIQKINQLVSAAAFAEKTIKISNKTILPTSSSDKKQIISQNYLNYVTNSFYKTTNTTIVYKARDIDKYVKINYLWGYMSYYKNNIAIDKNIFESEIIKYKTN